MNRQTIAYHEAGHCVAALRLGIPFTGRKALTIIPRDGHAGLFTHRKILPNRNEDNSDRARLNMERIVIMCLAGIEAQRRFDPASIHFRDKHGDWDGGSDYSEAIGLIGRFTSGLKETELYLELLRMRAEALVREDANWMHIQAVANALLQKQTISAARAKRIIQETTLLAMAVHRI